MTEDGLTIYAKWEKPKYTVDFVTNCEEDKASITREKGFVLTEDELQHQTKRKMNSRAGILTENLAKKFIQSCRL